MGESARQQTTNGPPAVAGTVHSFSFGTDSVLKEISLTVSPGEAVAVLGPSGCGKSTLVRIIAGLLPSGGDQAYSGRVQLFGLPPAAYRQTGKLAAMFQDPTLLPHLTVRENVDLPLRVIGSRNKARVDDLLELVGLANFAAYLPRDLSGGMRTRVALARAFVSSPELLLLDEPFTGLDIGWKESLYASLMELRVQFGTTVLMVTHDLEEAVFNCDRICVMGSEGTFDRAFEIPGQFPRGYSFGETVSHHTDLLRQLAGLLTRAELGATV